MWVSCPQVNTVIFNLSLPAQIYLSQRAANRDKQEKRRTALETEAIISLTLDLVLPEADGLSMITEEEIPPETSRRGAGRLFCYGS